MLVLASASASRAAMLRAAGVAFEARAADIDERRLEAAMAGEPAERIASALAEAKALAVAGDLVLGGDSLVVCAGRRFAKPASREEAAEHLRAFSGRELHLHSAAALARGGAVVWRHAALARMQVRHLSEAFIAGYLAAEWPAIAACVGAFRIEALGAQLFASIDGDMFTVLGLPLLAVLAALRDFGELPA